MTKRILITGCSGGGKSTLVAALQAHGHSVVAEPGRRIVAEETACGGEALPWVDAAAFVRRAVEMSRSDLAAPVAGHRHIFFDRGLVDAAVALEHTVGTPMETTLGGQKHYADPVFLAPPWPELFQNDAERRHTFADAVQEFERLERALARLAYEVRLLPKAPVEARMAFVLDAI
ncbi:MAG: AAA family ATPase [Pseudomonadota bacterium]